MTSKEGLEQCERIIELIDDEVSDRAKDKAGDFFEDVREKCVEVSATIEKTGVVTPGQAKALAGWEEGVRKWIH